MTEAPSTTTTDVMFCTVHPNEETGLRCNKCGRPMCTKCAISTPVGYRCRECVKGQQKVYFNAKSTDPLLMAAVAAPLGAVGGGLISVFGFGLGFLMWILAFIVGTAAGGGIADLSYRVVGKRRARNAHIIVAGAIVLGSLFAFGLANLLFFGGNLITWGVFTFAAASGAVGRLRMSA